MSDSRITRFVRGLALAVASSVMLAGCVAAPEGASEAGEVEAGEVEAGHSEHALDSKSEPLKECAAPDKTGVWSTRGEYAEAARALQSTCNWEPCHCTIDGLETSCSLVAACLRIGFCVLRK